MVAKKRTASGLRKDAAPSSGANHVSIGQKKSRERKEKQKPALAIAPQSSWHSYDLLPLPTDKDNHASTATRTTTVDRLHEHALSLLESENKSYAGSTDTQSSAQKFTATIMAAGTLEDKVSALTLLVQESPLHGMKTFDNLLGLAKKKNRNQAIMAAAAIKDLLAQGSVLPDRKLRIFSKQPGLPTALVQMKGSWSPGQPLPGSLTNAHLLVWAFEDWLKKQYFDFLKVLEGWCSDEVEYSRSRAITMVWELLKDKPEQEENLLRLLVNKLGDTDRKIASRTSYLLLQLQIHHPVMKRVIIDAVENECLFRPNATLHARYYAIITLNQTILGKADQQLASELLRIYFSMFVQLLKPTEHASLVGNSSVQKQQGGGGKAGKAARQKAKARERAEVSEDELREKMTAQVLTGVNRAFPFADSESADFDERIDTIFRITHSSNFNTSIQALMLLQKLSTRKHHGVDRFYRTLYESLLDPRLITSSKQIMYLNLLYKSLKTDVNARRVQAFVKRLFQIMNVHEVPFVCGLLYLVSELETTFPAIGNMLHEPEALAEDEEEHFVDAPDETSNPQSVQAAVQAPLKDSHPYDPRKRDPEHANADRSSTWDILPLLSHYHPSVALFASAVLRASPMPPKPDPTSHTLIHFLDRFIYRNAKTKTTTPSSNSIMQPLSSSSAADMLIKSRGTGNETALNTEGFRSMNVKDVPPDQVFFHSYFNATRKASGAAGAKKKNKQQQRKGDDGGEVGSDDDGEGEDEDAIWNALVRSRPDIEGLEGDEDDDLSMGDLESAMASDDSDDDDLVDGEADGDDGGVEIADFPDQDEDEDETGAADDAELESDDDDGLEGGFDDEDALLGDDDEIDFDMDGLGDASGHDDVDTVSGDKDDAKGEKRSSKKRKLKHLPTFASVEDYAALLADEPDEDYS